MNDNTPCFTHTRFNLVELFVVIAVMSILLALLTPSLQQVLHKGHSIQCQSHLSKQVFVLDMYLNDHDQAFFNRKIPTVGKNIRHAAYDAYDLFEAKNTSLPYSDYKYRIKESWKLGSYKPYLMDYLNDVSTFFCPSSVTQTDDRDQFSSNFGMPTSYEGINLGSINTSLDQLGIFMDTRRRRVWDQTEESDVVQRAAKMSARHQLNVNIAFLDGHTDAIEMEVLSDFASQVDLLGFDYKFRPPNGWWLQYGPVHVPE